MKQMVLTFAQLRAVAIAVAAGDAQPETEAWVMLSWRPPAVSVWVQGMLVARIDLAGNVMVDG